MPKKPRKGDELSLEDTIRARARVLQPTKAKAAGYDPYDGHGIVKPKGGKRPTDLRELSKWILKQREVAASQEADAEDDPKPEK